ADGSTYTAVDTAFPTAPLGQTFATASGTFTDVPPALQHTVTINVDAESFSQAAAAFGLGRFETTRVLSQTFETATLAGRALTFGNFVSSSSIGALLSATTHSYSPYLVIGDTPSDGSTDPIIRGADYQEVFTNFPLGSQVLTGLFLQVHVTDPNGHDQQSDRTLFDRIGFANRRNGTSASVSAGASSQPSINELDLTTLEILPGRQDASALNVYQGIGTQFQTRLAELRTRLQQISRTADTTSTAALLDELRTLMRQSLMVTQRAFTGKFAADSD